MLKLRFPRARLLVLFSLAYAFAIFSASHSASADEPMLADAALQDVFFVDDALGCAVGERGVILKTTDGGKTWNRKECGLTCSLNSVWFANEKIGWIVGGGTEPYTRQSRGVILKTIDGGETWLPLRGLIAPALEKVKFFDAEQGVALGRGEGSFPAGVWFTKDGGNQWEPASASVEASWTSGDFFDPLSGVVAGRGGRVHGVLRKSVTAENRLSVGNRTIHDLLMTKEGRGLLVGSEGLLLMTRDLGRTWQLPAGPLPLYTKQFDFTALAMQGPNLWIAASPGSRIFHSPDGGQTWQVQSTGIRTPLRSIAFSSPTHGAAVGELGTILTTDDGGKTWNRVKRGGERAAMLVIVAEPNEAPLAAIANDGLADGYLTTVVALHDVLPSENDAHRASRFREAVIATGGTSAKVEESFAIPRASLRGTPMEVWSEIDRNLDGQAPQKLEARLIQLIRTWRPDVIVIESPEANAKSLGAFIAPQIESAIDRAGDPTYAIEFTSTLGLEPWQTKRIFGLVSGEARGTMRIDPEAFDTRLGNSLSAILTQPQSLISEREHEVADPLEFQLLKSFDPQASTGQGNSFFSGNPLSPGSEARRATRTLVIGDMNRLKQIANKRRNVKSLLERSAANPAWAAQMNDMVRDLDGASGAEVLYHMAGRYRAEGKLQLAARTYEQLAQRYPQERASEVALTWLVAYYASGEIGVRSSDATAISAQALKKHQGETANQPKTHANAKDNRIEQASFLESPDTRYDRAVAIGHYFDRAYPLATNGPAIRLPLAVAQRERGLTKEADKIFLALRQGRPGTPYWEIAVTEQWLRDPKETPPKKPIWSCRAFGQRPNLDGNLEDAIWKSARPVPLLATWSARDGEKTLDRKTSGETSEATNAPFAKAQLARDDAFFYLSCVCPKDPRIQYTKAEGPRNRDEAKNASEYVTFSFDIDRDFTTAWELSVDYAGRPHDACWGDATWSPTWYVAQSEDANSWTIEAAIPIREITKKGIEPKDVWAVGVRRTLPGKGTQSWTSPAGEEDPKHFGILVFE